MWAGVQLLRDLKGSRSGWYVAEKPMQKFVELLAAALGNMSMESERKVNLLVCSTLVLVRQTALYWSQNSLAQLGLTLVWLLKVVGISYCFDLIC